MTDLVESSPPAETTRAYWNGPPPPYAPDPVPPSFWARRGVWIALTVTMAVIAIAYFVFAAIGSASAPGGCGGG